MTQQTEITFESNEQLRGFLTLDIMYRPFIPKLHIWCKVTEEDFDSKCPSDLGDGRYKMSNQFYGQSDVEGNVYVLLGHTHMIDEETGVSSSVPTEATIGTGVFQAVDNETQDFWIAEYGVETMHLEPEVNESEVVL